MIHQTLGGAEGQATDIEIAARHIVSLRENYAKKIAANSGQDVRRVLKDIERDNWMSAEETKKYGIVDKVLAPQD